MRHHLSATLLARLPVSTARKAIQKFIPKQTTKSISGEKPQLLVDISELIANDARTGIQRVVRGILLQLLTEPPEGYQVKPIFAERSAGYRYAPVNSTCLQADETSRKAAHPVYIASGDIFLGLDLAAHLVPLYQGQLLKWKRSGVKICFFVYDLLPLLHPHWFKPSRQKTFARWMRCLGLYADDLICISETVKNDLINWLHKQYNVRDSSLRLHTIPLGADIENTLPTSGCSDEEQRIFKQLRPKPFVLMVGTLEPRKGYEKSLAAFERIWADGEQTALVIVGKPGWKTEQLQKALQSHPELKKKLYWFEHASDDLLQELYKATYGVLLASEAEGFGLPLVEAHFYGKPVLARDLAVFRESNRAGITFFEQATFTSCLAAWLQVLPHLSMQPPLKCHVTWAESARHFCHIISVKNTTPSEPLPELCRMAKV